MNPYESLYKVGGKAEVFSYGRWYLGTVLKVNAKTLKVKYSTGSGKQREKAFSYGKVRTAPGQLGHLMKHFLFK